MVCSVKSISGGGFFSLTARIAFSSFWLLSRTIPPALGSAIVMLDWGWLFSSRNTKREMKEGESSKLSGRDLGVGWERWVEVVVGREVDGGRDAVGLDERGGMSGVVDMYVYRRNSFCCFSLFRKDI